MRSVPFAVDCETAYDYLVDPGNRGEWQSSLKGVDRVEGRTGVVGQAWDDVTFIGVRPRMELTDADRPHRWSERGTWRGVRATLTLTFTPSATGCEVVCLVELGAGGLLAPLGFVLDRLAPLAVRSDLRRAARVLAGRGQQGVPQ